MEKNGKYSTLTGPNLPRPFIHHDAKNEPQEVDNTNVAMNKIIGTLYADYKYYDDDYARYERDVDE